MEDNYYTLTENTSTKLCDIVNIAVKFPLARKILLKLSHKMYNGMELKGMLMISAAHIHRSIAKVLSLLV